MPKKIFIIVLITIFCAGGIGFFAGVTYNQNKTLKERQIRIQQFDGNSGQTGQRGARSFGGGNFMTGEIITRDDKSLTLKLRDGSSKIIFLSESTEVGAFVKKEIKDLQVGQIVNLNGKLNPDGSLTALLIQIREGEIAGQRP